MTATAFMVVLSANVYEGCAFKKCLLHQQAPGKTAMERLIGSIRRECLNHVVILNTRHLKRTLTSYFDYYQRSKTHLALGKDCPTPRAVLGQGKIIRIPYLGGLHHCYKRIAA